MNTKKQSNSSKLEDGNESYSTEIRIETDRKITEMLHVKEIEGKYHVTLWGGAITPGMDTQEEAIRLIENRDIDMLITAMWGVACEAINNWLNKTKENNNDK